MGMGVECKSCGWLVHDDLSYFYFPPANEPTGNDSKNARGTYIRSGLLTRHSVPMGA